MFSESITDLAPHWWSLIFASALKAALVLVAVECLVRQLRHRSPAARHWVWAFGVSACLALPLLAVLLPTWGLLPGWMNLSEWVGGGEASEGFAGGAVASTGLASLRVIAPLVWIAGACLVLGRWLLGRISLSMLSRRSCLVTSGPLRSRLDRLAREIGMGREVVLLISEHRSVPMTWGVARPTLLLPSDARHWTGERITSVMLHELAHLRRRDCLWQLFAQLACAMYWFQPFVWRAAREMHIERESACDDLVLTAGVRPTSYAESLLYLTRHESSGLESCSAVAMAGEGAVLEMRLLSILDDRRVRTEPKRSAVWLGALAMALLAPPLAMLGAVVGDQTPAAIAETRPAALKETPSSPRLEANRTEPRTLFVAAPSGPQIEEPGLLQLLEMAAERRAFVPAVDGDGLVANDTLTGPAGGDLVLSTAPLHDRRIAATWRDEPLQELDFSTPQPLEPRPSSEGRLKAWPIAGPGDAVEADTHSKTSRLHRAAVLDTKGPMVL